MSNFAVDFQFLLDSIASVFETTEYISEGPRDVGTWFNVPYYVETSREDSTGWFVCEKESTWYQIEYSNDILADATDTIRNISRSIASYIHREFGTGYLAKKGNRPCNDHGCWKRDTATNIPIPSLTLKDNEREECFNTYFTSDSKPILSLGAPEWLLNITFSNIYTDTNPEIWKNVFVLQNIYNAYEKAFYFIVMLENMKMYLAKIKMEVKIGTTQQLNSRFSWAYFMEEGFQLLQTSYYEFPGNDIENVAVHVIQSLLNITRDDRTAFPNVLSIIEWQMNDLNIQVLEEVEHASIFGEDLLEAFEVNLLEASNFIYDDISSQIREIWRQRHFADSCSDNECLPLDTLFVTPFNPPVPLIEQSCFYPWFAGTKGEPVVNEYVGEKTTEYISSLLLDIETEHILNSELPALESETNILKAVSFERMFVQLGQYVIWYRIVEAQLTPFSNVVAYQSLPRNNGQLAATISYFKRMYNIVSYQGLVYLEQSNVGKIVSPDEFLLQVGVRLFEDVFMGTDTVFRQVDGLGEQLPDKYTFNIDDFQIESDEVNDETVLSHVGQLLQNVTTAINSHLLSSRISFRRNQRLQYK
ncbi:hypothetical protein BSL78_01952 [Apostichopus japonicus]|uniref:Uncharacterized protein n=1 Tax=Stichopus japonicus TaxID=307972 RepID=A0A2G8LLI8_STIJA|nr:hypothetical protein BSL78_01952 [Apostichopus japonicus]